MRYEEAGTTPYVIGHALDVTERVRAAQALQQARADLEMRVQERTAALQEAETTYRTLVEQARGAIVIVQDGQHIWECSESHVQGGVAFTRLFCPVGGDSYHQRSMPRASQTIRW